jgi:type IV secretion system protein VirD4
MKERPVTVYLTMPAHRLGSHSSWLRLMIGSITQRLMRGARSRIPILYMLDEFAALAGGSGTSAESAGDGFPAITGPGRLDLFRSFGIKTWLVWQSLAQATRIFGDPGFQVILANAGVIQTFGLGDVVSSDYFSQLSGQTTRQVLSTGESLNPNALAPGGAQRSHNMNVNLIPRQLMLSQDFRSMREGYSIVFSHHATGPIRCFTPWPADVPELRPIMALDPNRQ